jgi:2-isopropylmalate synthase
MKMHLKTNLSNATENVVETIQYAKDHGLKVRYTPEDSVRTDYDSLLFACQAAISSGVDRISIADTVGAMSPSNMYKFFLKLKNDLDVELNVHCHNDLGLAVANALAAYEGGASLVDVTVNGLGERAGISSISEICIAFDTIYKEKNNWNFEVITELSNIVSKFSGINVPPNAPIIGENVFVHNAGLHVAAVIANLSFYEVFPAELIGRKRTFVLDKMASVHTIKQKLKQVGVPLCDKNISKVYNYAKLKEKGTISNDELLTLFIDDDPKNIIYQ